MLLQAKALTTAAEWAQAYAELAKEKDALAKEKDALTFVTKEKDAQLSVLTKENRILANEQIELAKEKDALAKQLSQCTALGNSTGLFGTLVSLGCRPSLTARYIISAFAGCCTCDVCSCSGGRRRSRAAAEASSRSRCQSHSISSITCGWQLATLRLHNRTHRRAVCRHALQCNQRVARRSYEEASGRRRRPAPPSFVAATRSALSAAGRPSRFERSAAPSSRAICACHIRLATLQPICTASRCSIHSAEQAACTTVHRA
jgi:hypothetical protein